MQLSELDPFSDGETEGGSSALQLEGDKAVKLGAAVATVLLVGGVVLGVAATIGFSPATVGVLIAWAIVSVFSCGLWNTGVWHGSNHKYEDSENATGEVVQQGMSKKTALWKTVKCAGKVIVFPLILLYKGFKWLALNAKAGQKSKKALKEKQQKQQKRN